jgi:transposase
MRRHELTSEEWQGLKQLLVRAGPGRPPKVSDRRFVNAVLWKVKTGAPWRDLPPRFGKWKTIYSRFRRWAVAGHFKALFEALQIEVDDNWNAIDGSYVRAHQHAAGGKGGPSARPLAFLEAEIPRSFMLALMRREDLGKSS